MILLGVVDTNIKPRRVASEANGADPRRPFVPVPLGPMNYDPRFHRRGDAFEVVRVGGHDEIAAGEHTDDVAGVDHITCPGSSARVHGDKQWPHSPTLRRELAKLSPSESAKDLVAVTGSILGPERSRELGPIFRLSTAIRSPAGPK